MSSGAAALADPQASRGGVIAALRRVPAALWVLLAVGLGLRLALWLAYSPALINLADSIDYAAAAAQGPFSEPGRSAGYPVFLAAVHALSAQLEVTIALQHLIGIASALLLYATVRRLGAPIWVGCVGAAAVLLSLDQIMLEHAVMSEALFTLLLVGSLYLAVRALDEESVADSSRRRFVWIAASAATLAAAAWVRPVAVPEVALLVIWFAVAIGGSWRRRLAAGAVAAAAAALVLVAHAAINYAEDRHFAISETSGWALYSRVAPFADCARFDPPAGTRALCEELAVDERPGPDFYSHEPGSPARQLFGEPPTGNEQLGAFARQALLAQPLSYLSDLGRDVVRYFHPAVASQPYSGVGLELLDADRRAPGSEEAIAASLNSYYADDAYEIDGGVATVAGVQDVLRVHPKLLLAATLLAVAGVVLGRGRLRAGVVLLAGGAVALMVIAPATAIWSARYAIPVSGPLVAAGAIGAWLVAVRLRETRARSAD